METLKYRILGSDFLGVYATATENFLFIGDGVENRTKDMLAEALGVVSVNIFVSNSNLVGLLARGNSNGILFSNLIESYEYDRIKSMNLGLNIGILDSNLNAIGCDVLVNDKLAIVNMGYKHDSIKQMQDVFGVEVVKTKIGGFNAVGANNILTNKGLVLNNRGTDEEKESIDKIIGFDSIRTTANKGSLAIGLATIANSRATVVGSATTGFELERIIEGLEGQQ